MSGVTRLGPEALVDSILLIIAGVSILSYKLL